ncbi:hypothetical protein VVR12_07735 [Rothia sp. LK2588]|uniref:hypothetical protein n=1 Tax=Rothia sp. LK2588 TaxID=3114369 RepID=UPI0034CD3DAF
MYSVTTPEQTIVQALEHAMPHMDDPERYQASFISYLEAKGFSANLSLPTDGVSKSSAPTPSAVPAVIIAARFAFCVSSAYTILADIPANASYTDKAMRVGAAIAGCIGGGAAGNVVGRWIINNPRMAASVFNAVGLGHLSGDSARR